VGELFYRTPMLFKEYLKEPEKTREAFDGEYSSAGDMVKRDEDGYYTLVDRKANMIITGGENVYPSEVESAVGAHEAVKDIAVIGIPDEKWGEAIKAVVVLNEGYEPTEQQARAILDWSKGRIAGYKRPKSIDFVKDDEMPRTPTGKILHRILREKYGKWGDR
jgi:acyl-CoA synthetase (AMP-forming)/AMP-acid ligase II